MDKLAIVVGIPLVPVDGGGGRIGLSAGGSSAKRNGARGGVKFLPGELGGGGESSPGGELVGGVDSSSLLMGAVKLYGRLIDTLDNL